LIQSNNIGDEGFQALKLALIFNQSITKFGVKVRWILSCLIESISHQSQSPPQENNIRGSKEIPTRMSRRLMRAFVEGDVEQALELIDHQQCDIKWLRELPSNSLILVPSRMIDQGRRSIREFIEKRLVIANQPLARALESIDRLEASLIETQQRLEREQQALAQEQSRGSFAFWFCFHSNSAILTQSLILMHHD